MIRLEGWYWVKWQDKILQQIKPFPAHWTNMGSYWRIDGVGYDDGQLLCLSSAPLICPLAAFL